MELDLSTIDLSLYQKQEGRVKTSTEVLTPRVTLKKTEQLYHRKHSSSYITVVLVEKYIDDTPVNSWSWIQEADIDDVLEFPSQKSTQHKKRYQDRKEYYKEYYQSHRDPNAPTRKSYKDLTPEEKKALNREKARRYYQLHREEIIEKHKLYNLEHKDKKKQTNKNYYNNHKKKN